jgi:hypothetical protein
MNAGSAAASIVLVHGGFVDGSGWRAVYDLLTQDGYLLAVTLDEDVGVTVDDDVGSGISGSWSGGSCER